MLYSLVVSCLPVMVLAPGFVPGKVQAMLFNFLVNSKYVPRQLYFLLSMLMCFFAIFGLASLSSYFRASSTLIAKLSPLSAVKLDEMINKNGDGGCCLW